MNTKNFGNLSDFKTEEMRLNELNEPFRAASQHKLNATNPLNEKNTQHNYVLSVFAPNDVYGVWNFIVSFGCCCCWYCVVCRCIVPVRRSNSTRYTLFLLLFWLLMCGFLCVLLICKFSSIRMRFFWLSLSLFKWWYFLRNQMKNKVTLRLPLFSIHFFRFFFFSSFSCMFCMCVNFVNI